MKKEKSKVLLTGLIILVSLILTLNLYFQNEENNCLNNVKELINERDVKIYFNILQSNALTSLQTSSFITNTSNIKSISENELYIYVKPEMRTFIHSLMNTTSETQSEIFTLNEQINNTMPTCKEKSFLANISLYIAIIVNLGSLIFSIMIYSLYKT